MTGPEHYRRAEQLEAQAAEDEGPSAPRLVARAQVHATLALAAATAAGVYDIRGRGETAWHAVGGSPAPEPFTFPDKPEEPTA